jgi:hypothetical protein
VSPGDCRGSQTYAVTTMKSGRGMRWLGLGRLRADSVSAMRTSIDACNGAHYAVALFFYSQALSVMAQLIHPDAVLNFVPARILLVRDSNVSAHSASRSGSGASEGFQKLAAPGRRLCRQ